MRMRSIATYAGLLLAGTLLAACGAEKGQAQKAIAEVESAVQSAGPDAQRYLPGQLAGIRTQLETLRASMKNQDYQSVIANAPAVLAAAKDLPAAAAATRKENLIATASEWSTLAGTLPHEIESIDHRISSLERARHLPHGLDHKQLETIARSFMDAKGTWNKATIAFEDGKVAEAVEKAKSVQSETTAIMSELRMTAAATSHS